MKMTAELKQIRTAIADYISSEGCQCCEDMDAHVEHKETLAKLLKVKKYSDGSGYDFSPYRTNPPQTSAAESE